MKDPSSVSVRVYVLCVNSMNETTCLKQVAKEISNILIKKIQRYLSSQ